MPRPHGDFYLAVPPARVFNTADQEGSVPPARGFAGTNARHRPLRATKVALAGLVAVPPFRGLGLGSGYKCGRDELGHCARLISSDFRAARGKARIVPADLKLLLAHEVVVLDVRQLVEALDEDRGRVELVV